MKTPILICCAAALIAGVGCEKEAPPELRISGDTLVPGRFMEVNGVAKAAECRTSFAANLTGAAKGEARIVAGQVTFKMMDGGSPISEMKWTEKDIAKLWPDTVIKAGSGRASTQIGMSISLPMPKLEGTAIFDYKVNNETDNRTTAPFVFHCR